MNPAEIIAQAQANLAGKNVVQFRQNPHNDLYKSRQHEFIDSCDKKMDDVSKIAAKQRK